ncbi:MAG: terminase small subunit [Oscillospiraceae bacterium]
MSGLTQKEQLFCTIYSNTRNAKEAAARAGYTLFLEKTAEKLLANSRIKSEIGRRDKEKQATTAEICAGLRRLAFGSGNDAVKLLYSLDEMEDNQINSLDLFNVSDIKKPKGGGLEIKFFDRQKALEKLFLISCEQKNSEITPFYEALEKSAEALSNTEEEDEGE